MRLSLKRSDSIDLTINITLLTLSHLCLIFLVRLGGYIVNVSGFYSNSLIGKLTNFLQLQEFSSLNLTVDTSTSDTRQSTHYFNRVWTTFSTRLNLYVVRLT
jgi:hypothetical protein